MSSANPPDPSEKSEPSSSSVKSKDSHDSAEFRENKEPSNPSKKPSYRGITVRNSPFSESYDEYLECIYRLSLKNPAGWVKNIQISKRLKVKAPSVTNMLEKLSKAELIEWKPRSGIRLLEAGRKRAKDLVAYHSIIELFLYRVLGMTDPEAIDNIACDFEHHITPEMGQRLVNLLGISGDWKNVDNFIIEDRLPTHIKTRIIYSEKELLEVLDDYQGKILGMIDDNNGITPEKVKNFHKKFRSNLMEKKNTKSEEGLGS
ncbi:MAG: metal-dependent transcriptional regulator [Promethearchaeota archaeon]